ncbi:hypothetical protein N505_0106575 [Rhodococcus aetherivorans]|nr:hypothetical protein N505_0106575 [Rhodococcus aetherivorans]
MTDVSNEIDEVSRFTGTVGARRPGETVRTEVREVESVHALAHLIPKAEAWRGVDENVVPQE